MANYTLKELQAMMERNGGNLDLRDTQITNPNNYKRLRMVIIKKAHTYTQMAY